MTRLSADSRFLERKGSRMIKRLLTTRVIGAIGAAVIAVATLTAPKLAAPDVKRPAAALCPNWTGAPPVSPGNIQNEITGVTVVSACRAWLVGDYKGGHETPLAERWNGSAWIRTTVPHGGGVVHDNFLRAVSARAADDVWAVGDYDHGDPSFAHFTLIERWNGSSWFQVPSPNPGGPTHNNLLFGVATISVVNAWAVGSFSNGTASQTLVLHWNGSAWKRIKSPSPGGAAHDSSLVSVQAISATNAWAVGWYSDGAVRHTLILHWNGKAWRRTPSPNPAGCVPGDELISVSGTSATNAWAVGLFTGCFFLVPQVLIEHWNGKAWRMVRPPKINSPTDLLTGVAAISASNAWAVGTALGGKGFDQTLVLHWNGKSWSRVASPDPGGPANTHFVTGVAAWSASSIWTVGDYGDGARTALALHCC